MTADDEKPSLAARGKRLTRDGIAIALWVSAITFIVRPSLLTVITNSLGLPPLSKVGVPMTVFAVLLLTWFALGSLKSTWNLVYIFFYPVILASRHLPKFFAKYSLLLITFSPALYSAATLIRANILILAFSILAAVFVFAFDQPSVIIAGTLLMAACLAGHFLLQLKNAFAARTIFGVGAEWIRKTWEAFKDSDTLKLPGKRKNGKDPDYDSKVFTLYAYSTVLQRFSEACKIVAESRRLDIYLIVSWLATVAFTIFAFAFIFYGVERAIPNSFSGDKSLLSFVMYSVCVLTTSDLTSIEPATALSTNISAVELVGSLIILVLLVFIILTSRRDRYREDLDKVNIELDAALSSINALIEADYSLTHTAMESLMVLHNTTLAKVVMRLKHDKDVVSDLIEQIESGARTPQSDNAVSEALPDAEREASPTPKSIKAKTRATKNMTRRQRRNKKKGN